VRALSLQWDEARYCYRMRSKVVHERAESSVSDPEIKDFRKVAQEVLNSVNAIAGHTDRILT